jgi:hypothetical protein
MVTPTRERAPWGILCGRILGGLQLAWRWGRLGGYHYLREIYGS